MKGKTNKKTVKTVGRKCGRERTNNEKNEREQKTVKTVGRKCGREII
jgi:hypothetical protein